MPSRYQLVTWLFWVIPIASAFVLSRQKARPHRPSPTRLYLSFCLTGTFVGVLLSAVWSWLCSASVSTVQIAVACYWMTGVVCLLALMNLTIDRALLLLIRRMVGAPRHPLARFVATLLSSFLLLGRAVVLVAGVATILSAAAVAYRPKLVNPGTPGSILNSGYEAVSFPASDGVRLRGWWISGSGDRAAVDTVLLCHGFGGDKARDLPVVRELLTHGYNVLAFDFRAHGQSAGQLSTFGDLERRDVLGAVHWLRSQHADSSRRILGIGVNMGAAALLGAAADPSDDARYLDAIVAIDPFDSLSSLIDNSATDRTLPGPAWFLQNVTLPVCGVLCGADLRHWSATRDAGALWPRPLLVIHCGKDRFIPQSEGVRLFESAQQPKYHYWVDDLDLKQTLNGDKETQTVIRVFFDTARNIL